MFRLSATFQILVRSNTLSLYHANLSITITGYKNYAPKDLDDSEPPLLLRGLHRGVRASERQAVVLW